MIRSPRPPRPAPAPRKAGRGGAWARVLLLAAGAPLAGQEADAEPLKLRSLTELLQTPVITATRWTTSQEATPGTVFVLEASEIRRMAATSVPDLLRSIPGLDVQRAWDTEQIVGSRGLATLNNAKLLVLVDGRRMNLDYSGGVRWRELPLVLEEIDRIEVSLSPLSALYGANAFGGMVNIVTKRLETRTGFRAKLALGEKESQEYQLSGATWQGPLALSVSGAWGRSEGYGNRNPARVQEPVLGPDNRTEDGAGKLKDGWELGRLMVGADVEALGPGNLEVRLGLVSGDLAVPALATTALKMADNPVATRNAFAWGAYTWRLSPRQEARLSLGTHQWRDHSALSPFTTRAQTAELQLFSGLGPHQLTSGLSLERTAAESPELLDGRAQDDLLAAYLQDTWTRGPFTLTAGARYDKHTDLPGRLSPALMGIWSFGRGHSLRLGVGSAFRKPSFIESYLVSIPAGPPASVGIVLGQVPAAGQRRAERIAATQLDYTAPLGGAWLLRLNLFRNEVRDLISLRKVQPFAPYAFAVLYANTHDLVITGGEAELRWAPTGPLTAFLNLSRQDLSDRTPATTDRLGVPRWKANLGVLFTLPGSLHGSLIAHHQGAHTPQFGQTDAQGGLHFMAIRAATTVDVKVFQALTRGTLRWEYGLQALNLLDHAHLEFPIFDGNAPYFGTSATFNYSPEQRRLYENRNALNDRVLSAFLALRF